MADETYRPTGSHPFPSGLAERDVYSGTGAPTATVAPTNALYFNIENGYLYQWDGSSWNLISSGGGGGSGDYLCLTRHAIASARD